MKIRITENTHTQKNIASNSSHFAFLLVKLLQLSGLPKSFGSSFSDVTSDVLNNHSS